MTTTQLLPAPPSSWHNDHYEISSTHPMTKRVLEQVRIFYHNNPQIKESHGLSHVRRVHHHAVQAIQACRPPLSADVAMEIEVAALLHDVDDEKYFPPSQRNSSLSSFSLLPHAQAILRSAEILPPEEEEEESVSHHHAQSILSMIQLVSCSHNGNRVPSPIRESGQYHWLIPRWADRIEAVGTQGVVRCYQYNREHGYPLYSVHSPRPTCLADIWQFATPERFQAYQDRSGTSEDMISHYYDKLLHVACPPTDIVQNPYLEQVMKDSSKALIHVCLEFGATGKVNEEYFAALEKELRERQRSD